MNVRPIRREDAHRRGPAAVVALVAVIVALVAGVLAPMPGDPPAAALDGSQFDPGHIISDGVFYNQGAMTEAQIGAFLRLKVPTCQAGYTCLKDYREVTASRAADARCLAYPGGDQSAATIIHLVSQVCGINPQVLITLLEKEQGLVSDSTPSSRQYRSATGYGCPDTADCDAAYYGFANQVYNAARQFKNYQANPANWRYRAGQDNTILWHPNTACGSSIVHIRNQATAGLYIYTPYRPNAAALANLYGTGDACSSYGNRNFWRIFSDWFGSTLEDGDLVKAPDAPEIHLVVGGTKVLVPSVIELELLRPLFPYRTVARSYLDSLAPAGTFTGLIRDPLTGDVFLVENGVKHRFPTCELVAAFGHACGAATDLMPSQLAKFATGAEVAPFVKGPASADVFYLEDGRKRPIGEWATVLALYGRRTPWIAVWPQARIDSLQTGPAMLAPGTLVKTAGAPEIYMVDGTASKVHVTSLDIAADHGMRSWTVVGDGLLAPYPTASGPLTNLVLCGGRAFVGGGGALTALTQPGATGLPSTALDPITCDALPNTGQTQDGPLFVKTSSSADVHIVSGGTARRVVSWSALVALNGTRVPVIVTMSGYGVSVIPKGPDALAPAGLVRTSANPRIFLVDGLAARVPVDSFAITDELGVKGYATETDSRVAAYADSGTALRLVVRCGTGAFHIGGHGKLWKLGAADGFGLAATTLDPMTCAAMPHSTMVIPGAFFVKDPAAPMVYQLADGQKKPVSSWDRLIALNGGSVPTIVTIGGAALATIPTGPSA